MALMKRIKVLLSITGLILTASFCALAEYPFTNGLVAYYSFNGSANDASGFGRDGAVHGATLSLDRFGVSNGCYFFNGAGDYIDASSTINDVINTFSMSAWFRTTNRHAVFPSASYVIWASHGLLTWGGSSVGAGISAGIDKIQIW